MTRVVPSIRLKSPPPAAVADPAGLTITVEEGQTLWQIAHTHGVSVDAIAAANGLRGPELIRVGQRLVIPQGETSQRLQVATSPQVKRERAPSLQHEVAAGESLWTISQQYHVSVEVLEVTNDLTEDTVIHPGLKLVIPVADAPLAAPRTVGQKENRAKLVGTTVTVESGQTLSEIALVHGVSVSAIVEANGLSSAEHIRAGQRLTIPGSATGLPRRQAPVVATTPLPPARRIAIEFLWPTRGLMTSGFGWRRSHHHNGIDIAANRGAPIDAAKAGTVIFAGWYSGYGLALMIDHGDGVITIYGHASAILVHLGDQVEAGQTIGRVGCTGTCTGPHLHFEVRIDGRPSNPLQYLP